MIFSWYVINLVISLSESQLGYKECSDNIQLPLINNNPNF